MSYPIILIFFFVLQCCKVGDNMNSTLDHKCPNCDAVLKFNVKGQNFKCEYCRSNFKLEDLNNKIILSNKTSSNNFDLYICKNCGAEIIADANTSATSCIFCKNTAILKNKLEGKFNPKYIIPFKTIKEDAINNFKKCGKGKWLMPKEFNIKRNIKDIFGVYVPFWIYDFDSTGIIEADCNKISKWTSSGYRYVKTDTYKVVRGGNIKFKNIPVDGSNKYHNNIMNSIEPFDYNDMEEFNYSYLSGFMAEKYDVTLEQTKEEAISRAKNSFIKEMKKDIIGYDNIKGVENSINLYNSKSNYVLLPVWFLNIKYKDKIHTFAMNGQTGKIVGNIPIDIKKTIIIWISLFISIFVLIILLNLLGVYL